VYWVSIEANLYWILFSAALLAVALWEVVRPWRRASKQLVRRWCNHGLMVCVSSVAGMLIYRASVVMVAVAVANSRFGLLNRVWLPLAVRWLLGFVLLDLLRYALHRAFHAVPLLWRVHQVHHSDPDFDLSTGLRNHPFETLAAQAVLCGVIAVLTPPPAAVLAMELVALAQAFFSHANANLPASIERRLGMILITPQMHRVHHSEEIREQSANLGEVLPWWDRIFGTFLQAPEAGFDAMRIGLKGLQDPANAGLLFMLAQPFRSASVEQVLSLEPASDLQKGERVVFAEARRAD
jgi:sterol desaturase/sphingolipid hydroxylase (fatty acid hydroxylase superfamily)